MISGRYTVIGFAVFAVVMMFLLFSESEDEESYDYTGIVSNVHQSTNGFVFDIDSFETSFKCFSRECPNELGYYGISGEFSEDGSIFFVSNFVCLDKRLG